MPDFMDNLQDSQAPRRGGTGGEMIRRLLNAQRIRWAQARLAKCREDARRAERHLQRLDVCRRYWTERLLRLRALSGNQ